MWTYNYSDELCHTGVKGMKWGVRRAQKQLSKLTGRDRNSISKEEAEDFKSEVKIAKKNGVNADVEFNAKTGEMSIKSFVNSKNQKIGADYAQAIMSQAASNTYYKNLAVGGAIGTGLAIIAALGVSKFG